MTQRLKERAQSTVEFALVMPLFVLCLTVLIGTCIVCLQLLALHDIARTAARAAVTSIHPADAARAAVTNSSVSVDVNEDVASGIITVTARYAQGMWWFTRLLPRRLSEQSVSMMRESPIVFDSNDP